MLTCLLRLANHLLTDTSPADSPPQCNCSGMLNQPKGELYVTSAIGLGLVMENVTLQYKRNSFDILHPRSNIVASECSERIVECNSMEGGLGVQRAPQLVC